MDLEECDRCGEEYPRSWQGCPFCDSGEHPVLKMPKNDYGSERTR